MNNVLDQYILPGNANEVLAKRNMQMVSLGDGVNRLMSGHDRGVAYTFMTHAEYNPTKSKILGYAEYDEFDIITWHKSRRQRPTERVSMLPEELLAFDEQGQCVGGRYAESYMRYKEGKQSKGLPLDKWTAGELSTSDVATLVKEGIYSVEQLAEQSIEKMQSKFKDRFIEAWDRACLYVNGQDNRDRNDEQNKKLLEQQQLINKLSRQVEQLAADSGKGEMIVDEQPLDALAVEEEVKPKKVKKKAKAKTSNKDLSI